MARNFARGAPPPPGSIEYVAVGDMWDPQIAARKAQKIRGATGAEAQGTAFTDLDASARYVDSIDRAVKQSRRTHGDGILSRDDERAWDDLYTRWRNLETDARGKPTTKKAWEKLVDEIHGMSTRFTAKGMETVPVPYAGELMLLLRQVPSQLTVADMRQKLLAGAKCGDRLLADDTPWKSWRKSTDLSPLKQSMDDAKSAADIYGRSRDQRKRYGTRSPVHEDFLRRLTCIWIAAARLYGLGNPPTSSSDSSGDLPGTRTYLLGLLALAGVGYLGAGWLMKSRRTPVVGVPDAYPEEDIEP